MSRCSSRGGLFYLFLDTVRRRELPERGRRDSLAFGFEGGFADYLCAVPFMDRVAASLDWGGQVEPEMGQAESNVLG